MNKTILVVGIIVLVIGGYLLLSQNSASETSEVMPSATPSANVLNVNMNEQNDSGEAGEAMLQEVDGSVLVSVSVTGAPIGVTQPAHIHTGTCAEIGGVVYPLTSPVDGISQTTLDVSWEELMAQQPLALNIHKSTTEASVYVSCGDLVF